MNRENKYPSSPVCPHTAPCLIFWRGRMQKKRLLNVPNRFDSSPQKNSPSETKRASYRVGDELRRRIALCFCIEEEKSAWKKRGPAKN